MRCDVPDTGSAVCAFGYYKKILKKDLPEKRNSSSEVHFIFLSQMGKWEFKGGLKLLCSYVSYGGMQRHPNVDKISVYAREVHIQIKWDPT